MVFYLPKLSKKCYQVYAEWMQMRMKEIKTRQKWRKHSWPYLDSVFFALYKNTLWVKSGPVHAFYRCLLAFIRQMLPCFINHIVGTPKHVINNYLRISKDLLVQNAKTSPLATVIKVDFNYIMLTDFTVGNKLF